MVIVDISIELLIIIIIITVFALISLYAYLIRKRIKEVARQSKKKNYVLKKQADWHQYLVNNSYFSHTLIPKKEYEIQGVEEIFLAYVHNFNDSSVQEKIKHFCNEYLSTRYQYLLKSKSLSNRLIALYRIADFRINSLLEDCKKLESHNLTNEERFQILRIYALFDSNIFIEKLLASKGLSDYELKKLLLNSDDWIIEELIKQHSNLDLNKQYSLIDTIGLKRNIDFLPYLESLLDHEDVELRIRCLKAIYEIGIVKDINRYIPFVHSPNWEERLMAGKLFMYAPLTLTRPYIEKLLHDHSWWVRNQAAKTIRNAKGGKEILENIILIDNDRYAVDIAKEVLNK